MTTKLTRRTAMAGAAALPLVPAAALAQPVDADPAVTAYREWLEAEKAYVRCFDIRPDDDYHHKMMGEAVHRARMALADTVPTTLAGLALMVRASPSILGDIKTGVPDDPENFTDVDAYEYEERLADDGTTRFMRSLVAGAKRLAGAA
jgi:hypothetical protein